MDWLGLGIRPHHPGLGAPEFSVPRRWAPLGAFLNDNGLNTMFSSGFYMPGNFLGTMSDFVGLGNAGAASEAAGGAGAAAEAAGDAAAAAGGGGALAAPAAGVGELGECRRGVSRRGPGYGDRSVGGAA